MKTLFKHTIEAAPQRSDFFPYSFVEDIGVAYYHTSETDYIEFKTKEIADNGHNRHSSAVNH